MTGACTLVSSVQKRLAEALRRPPAAGAAAIRGDVTEEAARELAPEVRLARILTGETTRQQLEEALGLKHQEHFRNACLVPALKAGLIEMTIPDEPRGGKQRYRLTATGREATKKP